MKNRSTLFLILLGSLVFTFLFYDQNIGLNLLLFNLFVIGSLFLQKKIQFKSTIDIVIFGGTIITALLTVFYNSTLAISVNFISLFLLVGIVLMPGIRSLFYAGGISILNLVWSQADFYRLLQDLSRHRKFFSLLLKTLKLVFIPLVIVFIFLMIYKQSNPFFGEYVDVIANKLDVWFTAIFDHINIPLLATWILGLFICNYFLLGQAEKTIMGLEESGNMQLLRSRKKSFISFKTTSLKNEYKIAVLLFSLLNILLLIVNLFDISQVWFNFEWNGKYLKQFVHEGTYLLIFSILISMALTLFYFRGNLNFYKKNKLLQILAFIWLFQNAILTVSVAVRNFWYIHFFALAYKRIGVIFFLIFTLISIYLVYRKIKSKKSTYFLFSKNAIVFYVLLVVMSLFNWDIIIAKYNFSHYKTAFVHLDFLSQLSNKTLPYLDRSEAQLDEIKFEQDKQFHFEEEFMSISRYQYIINQRKADFITDWKSASWQEWNLADQKAYNLISNKPKD